MPDYQTAYRVEHQFARDGAVALPPEYAAFVAVVCDLYDTDCLYRTGRPPDPAGVALPGDRLAELLDDLIAGRVPPADLGRRAYADARRLTKKGR